MIVDSQKVIGSFAFPLILASQSPRRKQILESVGLACQVELPTSEEQHPHPGETLDHIMETNALEKALSVAKRFPEAKNVIVGADTLVILDGEALGKPTDKKSALKMLRKLSGRTHEVITGLALVSETFGNRTSAHRSQVTFHELAPTEIEAYANIAEPYDKAGSYAVQGVGALFIARIDGSYTNVMGLPVEGLLRELASLTGQPVFDFFPKKGAR
jgi:septum formation protein